MEVLTVFFRVNQTYSVIKLTDRKISKIHNQQIMVKFRGVDYDGIIIGKPKTHKETELKGKSYVREILQKDQDPTAEVDLDPTAEVDPDPAAEVDPDPAADVGPVIPLPAEEDQPRRMARLKC